MLRDRLRHIKCWITGGHELLDKAVKFVRYNDEFVIWRECAKCGRVCYDTIPAEWFRRATDRASGSGKPIKFSTYIDTDDMKDEYEIHAWNGQEIKFDRDEIESHVPEPPKEEQHESERVPQGN